MSISRALVGKGVSSGTSVTTAAGTTTGGPGSIFYLAFSFDPGVTVSSVSDSKGNTYTLIGSVVTGRGKVARYKCEGGTGGASHTATVNFSGAAYPAAYLVEILGAATSSPLDVSTSATPADPSPYPISSGTLSQAAELVLAMAEINLTGGTNAYTVSGGSFSMLSQESDGGNYWTSGLASQIVAATSSVTATFAKGGEAAANAGMFLDTFKEAAGGGSYSLSCAAGSYALTGQAVGLRYGRKLVAAAGSYALTGRAVNLLRGYRLAAGAGSYVLTGADALADYAMTCAAGSYVLTGRAVGLRASRFISAAAGAYTLTGQAATLRLARKIAAAQGSYTLTGRDVGLSYSGSGNKSIAAAGGTYTLTGQNVALRYGRRLVAAQGSYALTGQPVGMLRTLRLVAASGAYVLTGQSVTLRLARAMPAAAGSYTLAGQAVALSYSGAVAAYSLAAETGSYLLTGYAVDLTVARVTRAPSGGGSQLIYAGTRRPAVISGRRPGNINTRRT